MSAAGGRAGAESNGQVRRRRRRRQSERHTRVRAGLDDVRIHDLRHTFASGGLPVDEGLPVVVPATAHCLEPRCRAESHCMLRWHGQVGGRLAPPHLDGEFERAAVRRLAAGCQPLAQAVVPSDTRNAVSRNRTSGFVRSIRTGGEPSNSEGAHCDHPAAERFPTWNCDQLRKRPIEYWPREYFVGAILLIL